MKFDKNETEQYEVKNDVASKKITHVNILKYRKKGFNQWFICYLSTDDFRINPILEQERI